MKFVAALAALIVLAFPPLVLADDIGIKIDVGGLLTVQRSVAPTSQDPGYPRPGVGGTSLGVVVGLDVHVGPTVDVGVEWSEPARFDAVQTTGGAGGLSKIDNEHRDRIVSALVHLHPQKRGARVRMEAVFGPSFVWESTIQQRAYAPPLSNGPFGSFYPEPDIDRMAFGLTGGVDLDIAVTRHVSIVPQVRVVWISRDGPPSEDASALLGLDAWALRPAMALRLTF